MNLTSTDFNRITQELRHEINKQQVTIDQQAKRIAELESLIKEHSEPVAWKCAGYGKVTRLTENKEIADFYQPCTELFTHPILEK